MDACKVCPVCTLYLRPGITLKNHLSTHPKQKVIEALIKFSGGANEEEQNNSIVTSGIPQVMVSSPFQENHVFVYQRMMSSSSSNNTLNNNSSTSSSNQQYIIPTVLNPHMLQPYVYQQQQQFIMSTGAGPCLPQLRLTTSPFEVVLPPEELTQKAQIHEVLNIEDEDKSSKIGGEPVEKSEDCAANKACQTSSNITSDFSESASSTTYDVFKKFYCLQTNEDESMNFGNVASEVIVATPSCSNSIYTTSEYDLNSGGTGVDLPHVIISTQQEEEDDFTASTSGDHIVTLEGNLKQYETNEEDILVKGNDDGIMDLEDISRGSATMTSQHIVNIRTDERMPPKGELSGQESLGSTSEITWNRLHYEGNSATSYEIGRDNNWDDSLDVDEPTSTAPTLEYKCNYCDDIFTSLLDRNQHNLEKHTAESSLGKPKLNLIGTDIDRKKVKKIIVKSKNSNVIKENDSLVSVASKFDFSNTIKTEEIPDSVVSEEVEDRKPENGNIQCESCDLEFPDLKSLRKHKLVLHKKSDIFRFKCSACDETFANDFAYTVHLKIHPLECYMCGKLFYRRQNIELHMKRHMGIRPHKCDFCSKAFLTKQKMIEHKNIHTGDAPIKCSECSETFKRYSNLVQHRNRHHLLMKRKRKDFVCSCGEYFHSSKKLAWHKETHDSKPKSCPQCNEKFVHLASLTRHVRKAHDQRYLPQKERIEENVECPICKGVFIKSSLEVHMRTHSGTRPFTCSICHKDFTTKWNLKLHRWTHASRLTKPFKCDQCNGAFVRECDYKSHMNSHKNIKPYTCNHCGARFIRKSNCQRHVKEHESEKTYKCNVCGKYFHRSDYLKDHMRVHTGDRPYTCHVCGKTSTTKSNHNKHIQIHHARETVTTEN